MTGIYILSALVTVFLLLLVMPVKIKLQVQQNVAFRIRYLWFSFDPLKKQTKKRKIDKPKDITSKIGNIKAWIEKKGILCTVEEMTDIFLGILKALGRLLGHIIVSRMDIKITVAGEDAAQTAVEYGAVCAVVYPFAAGLESLLKVSKRSIEVDSDFDTRASSIYFFLSAKIRPLYLIPFLFSFFILLYKK